MAATGRPFSPAEKTFPATGKAFQPAGKTFPTTRVSPFLEPNALSDTKLQPDRDGTPFRTRKRESAPNGQLRGRGKGVPFEMGGSSVWTYPGLVDRWGLGLDL